MHGLPGHGYMGVQLFFAISGFLITTLLLREAARNGSISLKNFFIRRSLRIFPLYFTTLALYCFLVYLMARGTPAAQAFYSNLPYFLTYTSNWFVGTSGTFAFAWSLAAEEQFYATWPAALQFLRPKRAAWLIVILLALAISSRIFLSSTQFPLRHLPMAITWGCLAALILHQQKGFVALWHLTGNRFSSVVLLIACLLSIATPVAIHFFFASLVVTCVIREDHALALPQCHHLSAALHARALLSQHEFAAFECRRVSQQECDL